MIQSRAQFGVFGAIIPLIMVFCMYLGYASSAALYTPQFFYSIFPNSTIPVSLIIVLSLAITAFVVIIGYDAIHAAFKYIYIIMFILMLIITVSYFQMPIAEGTLKFGEFNLGLFLMGISIPAAYQACYAPYVADYSRYLPKETKTSHTFWTTYLSAVIGASWMMILGAFLASQIPSFYDNQILALSELFPIPMVFLVFVLI